MADTAVYDKPALDHADDKLASADHLKDSGASSLESGYNYHGISERRLLAKIDVRILPPVITLYLLSFLDRSNAGDQYLTGLTLFFIGYILLEVPWNIVLKRTSPRFWLPTVTIVWGVVATLTGIVQNLPGFFMARFFLGVAEGGLFPGVVYYLSMWYKRQERTLRVSMFFSAASLAGAFGGILAFGIAKMRGVAGQNGWRWIFIIEGILTVVVGAICYFLVWNYPATASFLSAKEKEFVHQRLKDDSDATDDEGFKWLNVTKALQDPKCWLYCAAFHTMSLPLYTLSLFLVSLIRANLTQPTIIRDLGYTAAQAQLLTIPPYALATIATVIVAWYAERLRKRTLFQAGSAFFAIIGYIILLANNGTHPKTTVTNGVSTTVIAFNRPGVSYVGVFFAAAGIYPAVALALSLPAINVSGQTKRAVACGMQITIGNLGAIIGTQIYRTEYSPRYVPGHATALGYLAGNIVVALTTRWYLGRLNKQRDAIEAAKGGHDESREGWSGDEDVRWRFTT